MTKQKTAKLDLNGQKVDVGIPSHLLSDLGGMVYYGALARLSKDKGLSVDPESPELANLAARGRVGGK